jgi:hypothetical protein
MQPKPNQPTKGTNVNETRGSAEPMHFESDRLNDIDREVNKRLAVADPLQPIALYVSVLLVAVGTCLILPFAKSFYVFLLLFSFVFAPLVIAMLPMWFWRNVMSQFVLTLAAIAYAIWFLSIYLIVWNARDAMAVVLFSYVGPIAIPFLLVACGISLPFHLWRNQD